ncbi:hypothetical protein, partial [Microbacterium mitrae]|uniref:hypothetical protein n=1 Tax=Microbacterium mitrae TaxID=664640 RepID=UPI001C9CA0CA
QQISNTLAHDADRVGEDVRVAVHASILPGATDIQVSIFPRLRRKNMRTIGEDFGPLEAAVHASRYDADVSIGWK